MLKDPEFYDAKTGAMFLPEGSFDWSPVEYRTPDSCGCAINRTLESLGLVPHDGSDAARAVAWDVQEREAERLGVDGPGSTMCSDCRDSWEIDYLVQVPGDD